MNMDQKTETREDTSKPNFDEIADDIRVYIETNMELYKLKASKQAARSASELAILAVISFFFLLIVIFGSIALAITLAKVTGELYLGYLLVAALYLVLALAFYFSKDRWMKSKLADAIIRSIYSK